MYKKLVFLVILLLVLSNFTVCGQETFSVAVNQSNVFTLEGVTQVAVANPDIADVVVVSESEILLVGKAPGRTSLHIWAGGERVNYEVEVLSEDILVANEIRSIAQIPDLKVSKVGKTIVLEGAVNSRYQKNRAEMVAAAYGDKIINMLEIINPVQIKLEARIVEINRQKERDIGIKWGNSSDVPGSFLFGQSYANSIAAGNVLGGLGGYANINAQLSALVKQGAARILSQPNIITVSGESANIMIGGQIPIPVSLKDGQITVEWKDYGIKLDIAPEANGEDLIHSKVKAEVSSLDWNSAKSIKLGYNLEIPPLKLSKAETVIALQSGQTMALGGLISSQDNKVSTKVPFLADLPILGSLFTSKEFSRNETELIILITPYLVKPTEYNPPATKEMQELVKENPWGGTSDAGKDKSNDR
ncbi:MAG: pilus assembly protein N-terminal domain-containing protein [Pelosinus sp.]|nr:pilus assembly protein N-terminal domain-containing protein [Pelosinus sp.]